MVAEMSYPPDAVPRIYSDLADWFPLLTGPEEYAEEAAFYRRIWSEACDPEPRSVLELGCGSGNNAFHLKAHFTMTLVDLSPQMLAVSRQLNPQCEHFQGDMRTVRLGRIFDAVFIHDALMYMLTEADLRMVAETAFAHCRPGGVALLSPDFVRESFQAGTETGGNDRDGRSLRYLEWTWDPDPSDATCEVAYAYMLRDTDNSLRIEKDRHRIGIFSRDVWLRALRDAGFDARVIPDEWQRENFLGHKPAK